jgi:beta-lactam-binding protein with PASTA domain
MTSARPQLRQHHKVGMEGHALQATDAQWCKPVVVLSDTAPRTAIARGRCKTGTIRTARSARVKKGLVLSQSPRPGAVLEAGARVDLVVNRGRR